MLHIYREMHKRFILTYRINCFVLGEADGSDAINDHSQNGDEQMDKRDPVCEERPGDDRTQQKHIIYCNILKPN